MKVLAGRGEAVVSLDGLQGTYHTGARAQDAGQHEVVGRQTTATCPELGKEPDRLVPERILRVHSQHRAPRHGVPRRRSHAIEHRARVIDAASLAVHVDECSGDDGVARAPGDLRAGVHLPAEPRVRKARAGAGGRR